jgi:hypothetical protein
VVFTGMGIITAKKGAADTTIHHVVPRRVGERNEGGTWLGHG